MYERGSDNNLIETVISDNQGAYNKNSKIYRFNQYDKDTVKQYGKPVEIYRVENTNIPEGIRGSGKELWIKGNIYGQTGSKTVAQVVSDEEAAKEQAASNTEKTSITSVGEENPITSVSEEKPITSVSEEKPVTSESGEKPVVSVSEEKPVKSEIKTSSAANVIEFNTEIDRLFRSDSSAAAVTTIEKIQPNALSAAIKAVGLAAAMAATAIGKIQPKPSDDLASAVSDAAGKTLASVTSSLMDVLAPDNKSELSKAISVAAKAAADAAIAVGELSAPMDNQAMTQSSDGHQEAGKENPEAADRIAAERYEYQARLANIAADKLAAQIVIDNEVAKEKQSEDDRVAAQFTDQQADVATGQRTIKPSQLRRSSDETQADKARLAKVAADKLQAKVAADKLAAQIVIDNEVAKEKQSEDDRVAAQFTDQQADVATGQRTIKPSQLRRSSDETQADKARLAKVAADKLQAKVAAENVVAEANTVEAERLEKVAPEKLEADVKLDPQLMAETAIQKSEEESILKLTKPDDYDGIMFNSSDAFKQIIGGYPDKEQMTSFSLDVLKIIGQGNLKGGAYLADNLKFLEQADKYINDFKTETNELLNEALFVKLLSLETPQMIELLITNPMVNTTQVTITDKGQQSILSAITRFLYDDLTIYVTFNRNVQELLFGTTFDEYCKQDTINNNRTNRINLLKASDVDSRSKMYDSFTDYLNARNATTDTYNKKNPNKSIERKYEFSDTTEPGDKGKDLNTIRVGELTTYIKEFMKLVGTFQNITKQHIASQPKEREGIVKTSLKIGTYDMYNMLIPHTERKKKQLAILSQTILPILEANQETLVENMNKLITINASKNIITYLKLRNDNNNQNIYNDRFKIKLNNADKSMLVRYMNDNFPFYHANSRPLSNLPENFKVDGLNLKIDDYNYNYLFGKFTGIFKPDDNNAAIADEMGVIIKKITGVFNEETHAYTVPPVPVFMLGYGASGAGKTSSLIYYNKGKEQDDKDGILVHLCKKLSVNYKNIQICSREFYHLKPDERLDTPTVVRVPPVKEGSDNYINFQYSEEKGFVLEQDYVHENYHQYRALKKRTGNKTKEYVAICTDEGYKYYEYSESEDHHNNVEIKFPEGIIPDEPVDFIALIRMHIFKEGTSLGAVAIHLIDTDRFVKATTNNPNSSRSHTLIFVKLVPAKDSGRLPGNIIIGDFAGVENKFACKDKDNSTIRKFLDVKRDDKSGNLYYSTEKLGQNLDPIGNIRGGGGPECDEFDGSRYSSYLFENPVVRKEWSPDIVNYYAENEEFGDRIEFVPKNKEILKSAISIILEWFKNFATKPNGSADFMDDLKTVLELQGHDDTNSDLRSQQIKEIDKAKLEWKQGVATAESRKSELNKSLLKLNSDKTELEKKDKQIEILLSKFINKDYVDSDENKKNSSLISENITKINDFFKSVKEVYRALYESSSGEYGKLFQWLEEKDINSTPCPPTNKNLFKYQRTGVAMCTAFKNAYKTYLISLNKIKSDLFLEGIDTTDLESKKGVPNIFKSDLLNGSKLPDKNPFNEKISIILTSKKVSNSSEIQKITESINNTKKTIYEINNGVEPDWNTQIKDLVTNTRKKFGTTIQPDSDKDKWFGDKLQYAEGLYDIITKIVTEKKCRESNADVICENRTEEGKFINDSLSKVRDVISKVLYEKNKTAINISPDFIDQCLDKYGSASEGRFNFEKPKDTKLKADKTGSVIFDEIYNVLNQGDGEERKKYNTVQELYKEIIVSVFCVFNISRGANNPPPVPYMDINDLKRIFFSGINRTNYAEFQRLGNIIIKMISEDSKPDGFKDKVGDLMNTIQELTGNLSLNIKSDLITIFGEFLYILSFDYDRLNLQYTSGLWYKERINRFIDMVDNSNAVSAIGTLEFVDAIAKYNAVRTVCNGEITDENYTELYVTGGTKSKSRNTKRHKTKRKPKQTTTLKSYSRR